jgi:hypothetical protein
MDIDFFFSKYTYEHCCIFDDFIVGLLADSVMLGDTLYANIGETVRDPPNLTMLSVGTEINTTL